MISNSSGDCDCRISLTPLLRQGRALQAINGTQVLVVLKPIMLNSILVPRDHFHTAMRHGQVDSCKVPHPRLWEGELKRGATRAMVTYDEHFPTADRIEMLTPYICIIL
jgi:hypothetical protein